MALYNCVDKGNKIATGYWQPQNSLRELTKNLNSVILYCIALQTASGDKSGLRFEISDPNYILIHVPIAYML